MVHFGLSPYPVTITTRIVTFLVGDPYKTFICHRYWEGGRPKVHAVFQVWFQNLNSSSTFGGESLTIHHHLRGDDEIGPDPIDPTKMLHHFNKINQPTNGPKRRITCVDASDVCCTTGTSRRFTHNVHATVRSLKNGRMGGYKVAKQQNEYVVRLRLAVAKQKWNDAYLQ